MRSTQGIVLGLETSFLGGGPTLSTPTASSNRVYDRALGSIVFLRDGQFHEPNKPTSIVCFIHAFIYVDNLQFGMAEPIEGSPGQTYAMCISGRLLKIPRMYNPTTFTKRQCFQIYNSLLTSFHANHMMWIERILRFIANTTFPPN